MLIEQFGSPPPRLLKRCQVSATEAGVFLIQFGDELPRHRPAIDWSRTEEGEGRGVGLTRKLHAYQLQDQGRDTVEANLDLGLPIDARSYDVGAQILTDLGVTTLRLMSNNPAKFVELEGYDLRIVGRVPLIVAPNRENLAYLRAKQIKLGHDLEIV